MPLFTRLRAARHMPSPRRRCLDRTQGSGGRSLFAIRLHPSFAVHPGAWLRTEIVEPHGLSVTIAAEKLHVTRQAMSKLLNGIAGLSAEMAIRFEKASGVSGDTMLRMQTAHDLDLARAREKGIKVKRVTA